MFLKLHRVFEEEKLVIRVNIEKIDRYVPHLVIQNSDKTFPNFVHVSRIYIGTSHFDVGETPCQIDKMIDFALIQSQKTKIEGEEWDNPNFSSFVAWDLKDNRPKICTCA